MKEFYRFSIVGLLCLSLFISIQLPLFLGPDPTTHFHVPQQQRFLAMISTRRLQHRIPDLSAGNFYRRDRGRGRQLSRVLDNGPPMLASTTFVFNSFTVNGSTYSFIVISPVRGDPEWQRMSIRSSTIRFRAGWMCIVSISPGSVWAGRSPGCTRAPVSPMPAGWRKRIASGCGRRLTSPAIRLQPISPPTICRYTSRIILTILKLLTRLH